MPITSSAWLARTGNHRWPWPAGRFHDSIRVDKEIKAIALHLFSRFRRWLPSKIRSGSCWSKHSWFAKDGRYRPDHRVLRSIWSYVGRREVYTPPDVNHGQSLEIRGEFSLWLTRNHQKGFLLVKRYDWTLCLFRAQVKGLLRSDKRMQIDTMSTIFRLMTSLQSRELQNEDGKGTSGHEKVSEMQVRLTFGKISGSESRLTFGFVFLEKQGLFSFIRARWCSGDPINIKKIMKI